MDSGTGEEIEVELCVAALEASSLTYRRRRARSKAGTALRATCGASNYMVCRVPLARDQHKSEVTKACHYRTPPNASGAHRGGFCYNRRS